MLELTDKAKEQVKKLLLASNNRAGILRVGVLGGGCSGFRYAMQFETAPRDGDEIIYLGDFREYRVVVDVMSAMYLDGCVMDYETTIEGSGFTFKNPNVKSTCGCGKSFGV